MEHRAPRDFALRRLPIEPGGFRLFPGDLRGKVLHDDFVLREVRIRRPECLVHLLRAGGDMLLLLPTPLVLVVVVDEPLFGRVDGKQIDCLQRTTHDLGSLRSTLEDGREIVLGDLQHIESLLQCRVDLRLSAGSLLSTDLLCASESECEFALVELIALIACAQFVLQPRDLAARVEGFLACSLGRGLYGRTLGR